MREVMGDIFARLDELNEADNLSARNALQANGVKFVTATDEERSRWTEFADAAVEKMLADGRYTKEFLTRMRTLLAEFRGQSGIDG